MQLTINLARQNKDYVHAKLGAESVYYGKWLLQDNGLSYYPLLWYMHLNYINLNVTSKSDTLWWYMPIISFI